MNTTNAHLYLPFVQALAEGKTLEGQKHDGTWEEFDNLDFSWPPERYRIVDSSHSFPPLPEGMEWHICDGLTPERLGPDHRPFVKGESVDQPHEVYSNSSNKWRPAYQAPDLIDLYPNAYRLPLSTPFPDGSFIKDGKLVKPEKEPWPLSRALPGFRPLAEGEEWHRKDFTEDMLPPGWRPLLLNELPQKGDEYYAPRVWLKQNQAMLQLRADNLQTFQRTTRPLPPLTKEVPLEPKDWIIDGPWWVRAHDGEDYQMVIRVTSRCIYTEASTYNHKAQNTLERSNDGINWHKCSKTIPA